MIPSRSIPFHASLLVVCAFLPLLAACDQIAVLDGSKAREADAVAVGSACRHAGRALEDCFLMNAESPKAQVFAGWKEMNDYMTEKKIDVVASVVSKEAPKAAVKADFAVSEPAKAEGVRKPDFRREAKPEAKPEARPDARPEAKSDARSGPAAVAPSPIAQSATAALALELARARQPSDIPAPADKKAPAKH